MSLAVAALLLPLFLLPAPAGAQSPPPPPPGPTAEPTGDETPEAAAGASAEPASVAEALRRGTAAVDLRYRFETVEEDRFPRDAHASTLRAAPWYRSAAYRGFRLFAQVEGVAALPDDDSYNNAGRGGHGNGVAGRPVVADPEILDLDQLYVSWTGPRVTVTAGRQEINIGDQRFVGAVGWRQNHQSFDAVRLVATPLPAAAGADDPPLRIDYAFVPEVHRIFGDSVDSSHHLLTVPISPASWRGTRLTLYDYYLDFEETLVRFSSNTLGLELAGTRAIAGRPISWEAEWATQDEAGDNRRRVDADYLHGRLAAPFGPVTASVSWERLEGSPRDGRFQTPLATLHKWNGWADKFLVTPVDGLETLELALAGTIAGPGVSWRLAWLDHDAESSGRDHGTEVDAQLLWTAPWGQGFGFKAALYSSDGFATDTDKIMLWTTHRFEWSGREEAP